MISDRETYLIATQRIFDQYSSSDDTMLQLWMRELAKKDLFFLAYYLLDRQDINRDWLFDRCKEVQANPNGYVDIWAREHYKSTIITFFLTIQDILKNPEERVCHESYR